MLRRTLRRMCTAGAEDSSAGQRIFPEGADYMPIAQACAIFGYNLNDTFEKQEIKKRFTKLALKHHPDHGGNERDFQNLVRAHKTLLAVRHDKGGKEGRFNFKNMNKRDHKEDRAPRERTKAPEEEQPGDFSMTNVVACVVFLGTLMYLYISRAKRETVRLISSRGRLREDEIKPMGGTEREKNWHPWSASPQLRDQMREVEAMVNGVRKELHFENRGLGAFVVDRSDAGAPSTTAAVAAAAVTAK